MMWSTLNSHADLHVHSKFSDRPSEWFLRRMGAPECYVEPIEVYRAAKRRGMDFVTISDHNCIQGALEIAHLPGTFLSCELTTYFPENKCKIHCLVHDITEAQFRELSKARQNIHDLHAMVNEQNICHAIAHPLFRINESLTLEQFEKLLLMFKRFEVLNGTRNARSAFLTQKIMESLTPDYLEHLADKHDLKPTGPEPWKKWLQGGSDDHSGVYVGSAHTATPQAESVGEFLAHIRRGDHEPAGSPGGSLHLAHCLYRIAYGYYRSRFIEHKGHAGGKLDIIELLMRKMIGDVAERIPQSKGLPSILYGGIAHYVKTRKLRQLTDSERNLIHEIGTLFSEEPIDDKLSPPSYNRKTFRLACQLSQTLSYRFLTNFHEHLTQGELLESLQTLASLGPAALSIAPYLAAFSTQHKDNHFLDVVEKAILPENYENRVPRKAWLTDTFSDTNGVCRTIQTIGKAAYRKGKHLTVLTCLEKVPETECDVRNFEPVGCFSLPEYENQEIAFPPFLEIVEYIERHEINELILSTPGPMGLVGLMAAKLMRIPVSGIYHTDFPKFVRSMTDDHQMEQMTWRYMIWFYQQLDHVFVPSEHYRRVLTDQGIKPRKSPSWSAVSTGISFPRSEKIHVSRKSSIYLPMPSSSSTWEEFPPTRTSNAFSRRFRKCGGNSRKPTSWWWEMDRKKRSTVPDIPPMRSGSWDVWKAKTSPPRWPVPIVSFFLR